MTSTRSPGRPPLAVILAAGVGRRLGALTADRPKALVEIDAVPLLEYSLRSLEAAGFEEGVVVTGHQAHRIDRFLEHRSGSLVVRSAFNPRYLDTNNIVSLLAVADALTDGFCLLNSDIVFDPSLMTDVRERSRGVWLVVDRDEPLSAEEMKVQLDAVGTVRRISKQLDPASSHGEFIGIARFDAPGAAAVLTAARDLVAAGGSGLYYEDAIDSAAPALSARVIATARRRWTEIDDLVDYERAQRVVAELALSAG